VLNLFFLYKYMGYKMEIGHTLRCFLSAAIMGAAVYATYGAAYPVLHSNTLVTLASILVGIVVYGIAVIATRTVKAEDVVGVPKIGPKLARIVKKLDVFGK